MKFQKILFIGVILLLLSCHQSSAQMKQRRPDSKKLVYQTYGLPELYHDKAMHEVLARYGVEMRAVAGCVVTDSLLKGVSRNNRALFAALDKRLGKDSKTRIMAEVEGVAITQQKVEEVLRKDRSVREKEAILSHSKDGGSLSITQKPDGSGSHFQVRVDVLQYASGNWQRSYWADFSVDTASGAVRAMR